MATINVAIRDSSSRDNTNFSTPEKEMYISTPTQSNKNKKGTTAATILIFLIFSILILALFVT